MRNWIVLSIIVAVLAAGCAFTSTPSASYYYIPSGNQEEQLQKFLVGIWNGYIVHPHAYIIGNTTTMRIFQVKRTTDGGWFVDLYLNGKKMDAKLTVDSAVIRIEFVELYEKSLLIPHDLILYGDHRIIGKIWYGTRSYRPAEVIFDKIK